MHGAAVGALVAEVLTQGALLVFGDVDHVIDQLVHAGILGGGDCNDGNAKLRLHAVNVHAAAVGRDLIHHIQGYDHWNVHLQKLHGQIEVAFNVRGVHNVDDRLWLILQDEIPGDDLLARIGRHRIDTGQIGDEGIGVLADRSVLSVHCNAGEIADVLVGAGELVEQGGLAAVLIAHEGKGQGRPLRERVAASLGMKASALAETRMLSGPVAVVDPLILERLAGSDLDFVCVIQAQCELVPVKHQLHRVSHRGILDDRDRNAGDQAHVEKMLAQGTFSADLRDHGSLTDLKLLECHVSNSLLLE